MTTRSASPRALSRLLFTAVVAWIHCATGLDNGLVRVPWMGWSAWEVFRGTTPSQNPAHSLSESLIRATADALVDGGFAAAGYKIVWIDDAWAARSRDKHTGALVPDPARWPNGMKAVADYVHSKGLKLGLYGDIGTTTCAGYPGLERPDGDFDRDAAQLAAWGVDAFKVDGCNADVKKMNHTYVALGQALNRTGRPMIYSCSWPDYERSLSLPVNFSLVAETCNSWRIFWDVQAGQYAHNQRQRFDCVSGYLEFAATGSTTAAAPFSQYCPGDSHGQPDVDHAAMLSAARPGSFNDADMLPIGANYTMDGRGRVVPTTAFTPTQARSAMALWVVLASPLMIGADVRSMDPDSRSVWLNKGLLRAHQDPLGLQGTRIRGNSTACQVWRRQLSGGDLLVVLYNNGGCGDRAPAHWSGPYQQIYSDQDCPNAGNHPDQSVEQCKQICDDTPGCDAFNYGNHGCALRSCRDPGPLAHPSTRLKGDVSYRTTAVPARTVTMTVTWTELGLQPHAQMSVEELIWGRSLGSAISDCVGVNLTFGESAALRLTPTSKL